MPIILTTQHITSLWGADAHGRPPAMTERTEARLRLQQRLHCAKNPATSEVEEIATPIEAYIGNGCWRIKCRCGERTHTNPEWGLACCFGCGAIYTHVIFPEHRAEIEALLVKRPVQSTRNWEPKETLDDLMAEQIAHGDPLP